MSTLCGANCEKCGFTGKCAGCQKSGCKPFGGSCIGAQYIKAGGAEAYNAFKQTLIDEFNSLHIEGMPEVTELNLLPGFYVNLNYPLPNSEYAKFLDDKKIYLGNQLSSLFDDNTGDERCFGIIADSAFLLVCEYGKNASNPEIVLFKRR